MTSKNSYWKLSAWNLKKRFWVILLNVMICFFMLPVATFINVKNYLMNYPLDAETVWIQKNIVNSSIMGSGVFAVITVVLAVFMALQCFSWINNRSKVDLYKSVPVKEVARFTYINVNSVVIFMLAFGVNLFLANIAVGINGLWSNQILYASILSMVLHSLLFIVSYVITLLAIFLTGNTVMGFFASITLLAIEPAVLYIKDALMGQYFHTFYSPYRISP